MTVCTGSEVEVWSSHLGPQPGVACTRVYLRTLPVFRSPSLMSVRRPHPEAAALSSGFTYTVSRKCTGNRGHP